MPQGQTIGVVMRKRLAGDVLSAAVMSNPERSGRQPNGRFLPGVSGMAVAKGARVLALSELARQHTEAAVLVLVEVMGDKKAPHAARTQAATAILDRGYGRPAMKVETTGGEDLRQMHLDALKVVASAAAAGGSAGAMAGAAMAAERVGAAAYFAERQQQIIQAAVVIDAEAQEAEAAAAAAAAEPARPEPKPKPQRLPPKGGKPGLRGQPRPSLRAIAAALKAKAEADDSEAEGQVVQL